MNKTIILCVLTFIITVLITVPVMAREICENPITNGRSCIIITPTLTDCTTYTYDILYNNTEGNLLETGTLAEWNNTMYYFNFTYSTTDGSYMIRLCDGSTMKQDVAEEDTMINALWIIFGATLFFVVIAFIWQNYTLAAMSGVLMMTAGIWIIINGIDGSINFLTHGFGGAIFFLGFWLIFKSGQEMLEGQGV